MFLLLPWFASFCGLAVDWLMNQARGWGRPIAFGGAALLIGLNAYQAYHLAQVRNNAVQTLETSFLRTAQTARQVYPDRRIDYLFVSSPDWGIEGLRLMQKVYPADLGWSNLYEAGIDQAPLPDWAQPILQSDQGVVVISDRITKEVVLGIEPELQAHKKRCPVRSVDGVIRLMLWVPESLSRLCSPEQ
jgi:hypothetical protein